MATKLTATFWAESVEDRVIYGKQKRNRVKLTLSSTQGAFYPSSGGIPLPTTLGMVRNIDYVNIIQGLHPVSAATGAAGGIHWNYVVSQHAIKGYWESGATSTANAAPVLQGELPTTWNPSDLGDAPVMYVEAVGW
jgi:hypothetical protein